MRENPEFISRLVSQGHLARKDADNLLNKYKGDAYAVYSYLVSGGAASAGALGHLWAESLGVSYVDLNKTLFQASAVSKMSADFARKNLMIPLYHLGGALTVAMVDPFDSGLIKKAEGIVGGPISPVFSPEEEIEDAIDIQYQSAGLDITEKRMPQDGRIKIQLTRKSIDLRISTVPTIYGEKAVLRIMGQVVSREAPDLNRLGLSKVNLANCRRVISTPNGVFFVTGPTGSGKTTTLFSILKHLNDPRINIMTVEDPVEYRLPGVNQVQVNRDIGLDFAAVLRSFLRQDPNVILIGEIRDMETAKIASQAALTGHLVLATMHTNNAIQAVTRLVEIGVEPFLVAPSIIGVMSQRLVRRLCDNCKEEYEVPRETMEIHFTGDLDRKITARRPRGCEECGGAGYVGRLAIHELFLMTENIRSMVARGESILDIQHEARRSGFRSMRHDGLKKVLRGLTTFEELERTVAGENY